MTPKQLTDKERRAAKDREKRIREQVREENRQRTEARVQRMSLRRAHA